MLVNKSQWADWSVTGFHRYQSIVRDRFLSQCHNRTKTQLDLVLDEMWRHFIALAEAEGHRDDNKVAIEITNESGCKLYIGNHDSIVAVGFSVHSY
jgi:hypothetical protein